MFVDGGIQDFSELSGFHLHLPSIGQHLGMHLATGNGGLTASS